MPPRLDLIVLATGVLVAVVLIVIGVMRVRRAVLALDERLESYNRLPLLAYVERAQRRLEVSSRNAGVAASLIDRAEAAAGDLARARTTIVRILTSPASLWRLGELIVTGR